jgi:hypothetical protein
MNTPTKKIEIESTILERAKRNDLDALEMIFKQFISGAEHIQFMEYLGQYGLILSVSHSFVCVTEKRIISLRVGSFGEVIYQDAFIEDLNSSVIVQPSILSLYVYSFICAFLALAASLSLLPNLLVAVLVTTVITLLLIPFLVKLYYKIHKCGMVFNIREGISVYVFVNRNRLTRANVMWRICAQLREERVSLVRLH